MTDELRSPVIIIGAARSGTNLLRDLITSWPGLTTWPCDEIPFIWRYGNARVPHDEFTPSMARQPVRNYIRGCFLNLARRPGVQTVVEKTCANSLRVGFVNAVLPEARFVYLVRDGIDAMASAMKRWVAPLDLPYLLRKARFVPWRDVPYYGLRFVGNRLQRLRSRERRLAAWGPRFVGLEEAARTDDLATVCARQWLRSVENSDRDLAALETGRVHRLRYEDLTFRPEPRLRELAAFLGVQPTPTQLSQAAARVSPGSVGKGREELDRTTLLEVAPLLTAALQRHGYPGP